MREALSVPDSDIKMTYWDTTGHHHEIARIDRLHNKEAKVLDLHTGDLICAPGHSRFPHRYFPGRCGDVLKSLF